MSVNTSINIDDVAVANNAAILDDVTDVYAPADTAYVYTGAARVGLNRLANSYAKPAYVAGDYATQTGTTSSITLAAENDDDARAQTIATALGITKAHVLSKAVCTGLQLLTGTDGEAGPF
jgi:hypothetical protein